MVHGHVPEEEGVLFFIATLLWVASFLTSLACFQVKRSDNE